MATRSSSKPGVVSRRVAPFAPLALAVAMQAGMGTGAGTPPASPASETEPAICRDDIADFQECHAEYPTGCSKKGGYDAYLNLLKNRLVDPQESPKRSLTTADLVALDRRLPPNLAKNNHADVKDAMDQLGEGTVVSLTGYLYYAKDGGVESSNCQLQAPDIDFHIGIGPDANLAADIAAKKKLTVTEHGRVTSESVIVEMTPHWRGQFAPSWNLDLLKNAIGRQVRVVGQLLADNEHDDSNDDCGLVLHGAKCWRATIWELHPVTGFQVCKAAAPCPDTSPDWVELEEYKPETVAKATQ